MMRLRRVRCLSWNGCSRESLDIVLGLGAGSRTASAILRGDLHREAAGVAGDRPPSCSPWVHRGGAGMKVGIVGATGWLGSALGGGLLRKGVVAPADLVLLNRSGPSAEYHGNRDV